MLATCLKSERRGEHQLLLSQSKSDAIWHFEKNQQKIFRRWESEALGATYLDISLNRMIRKRAGWLTLLFLGEMLTANAMAHYEEHIAKAVVLALFVPLIISSGGNPGSQASTIVIRAMALGEIRLTDWWHVMHREILT